MGLSNSKQIAFLINFGIAKKYWNAAADTHVQFHWGLCLVGTPAFASINSHLGVGLGRRDDLELLIYMLIYFLCGSLPWLKSDHEKLSSSSVLACKASTSLNCLCRGLPPEIATMLVYLRSLTFTEAPDYHYICSLFCDIHTTMSISAADSAADSLDISHPEDPIIHSRLNDPSTPCWSKAISQQNDPLMHPSSCFNDHSVAEGLVKVPLCRSTRRV